MFPNMTEQYKKNIWIKDPIHGFLEFHASQDQLFLQLLDTPEMQRLRRIRQLGTISFVYPAAEHSRFTHILGTYATAQNTLKHFRQRGFLDIANYREEVEIPILAAALLHDIGHGPFSHNFELITGIHHEDFTKAIILGDTQIHQVLRQHDSALPEKVLAILEHRFVHPVGNSMISSQLDVDRLDYICRDSYMTGANYGFLDIQRIVSVLSMHNDEVVVLEKGLGTIEEYLLARFYMYWEVYFHKTANGMALLLEKIFSRAQYLYQNRKQGFNEWDIQIDPRMDFLFYSAKKQQGQIFDPNNNIRDDVDNATNLNFQSYEYIQSIVQDFIWLDDHDLYSLLKQFARSNDPIIRDLSLRFLNRQLLKPLTVQSEQEKNQIIQALNDASLDPEYYFLENRMAKAIYTPNPISSKDGQGIKVLKENEDKVYDISEISRIINQLLQVNYHQKEYAYVPAEIRIQAKNSI